MEREREGESGRKNERESASAIERAREKERARRVGRCEYHSIAIYRGHKQGHCCARLCACANTAAANFSRRVFHQEPPTIRSLYRRTGSLCPTQHARSKSIASARLSSCRSERIIDAPRSSLSSAQKVTAETLDLRMRVR